MDRYRVIAPYVIVRTLSQDGPTMKGLGEGALVPDDASADWLRHHLRKKMIEKVGGEAPTSPPAQQENASTEGSTKPAAHEGQQASPPSPAAPPESGHGSSKQAWVDYAVARGMSSDEAASMSRDDLIAALREG